MADWSLTFGLLVFRLCLLRCEVYLESGGFKEGNVCSCLFFYYRRVYGSCEGRRVGTHAKSLQ